MEDYRDLVIFDSAAAGPKRDEVREALSEALPLATVRGIVAGEDIRPDVERAVVSGYDRIVVAGGDDAVASAAGGMLYQGMALGIVPLGERTLFARDLGIPLDTEQACELLALGGMVREISVMSVNARVAITDSKIGAIQTGMWGLGRTWRMRLRIDGTPRETGASLLVVEQPRGSSRSAAHLKLGVIRRRNFGEAVRAIGRMALFKPPFHAAFESFQVKRELLIEADAPMPIHSGSLSDLSRSIRIENLPGALRVITPGELRRPEAGGSSVAAELPERLQD